MGKESHNVHLKDTNDDNHTRALFTNGPFPMQNLFSSAGSHLLTDVTNQPDWVEFTSGAGAAFINIVVTFPVNKIIFRQQLHSIKAHKAIRQMQKEGIRHLYRGVLPPLLQRMTGLSLMFGLYDQFTRIIISHVDCPLPVAKVLAALLSGEAQFIVLNCIKIQTFCVVECCG